MISETNLFFILKILDKFELNELIKILKLVSLIRSKCPNITNEQLIEILKMIKRKKLTYEDVEEALTDDNYSFESIKKIISSLNKKQKPTIS